MNLDKTCQQGKQGVNVCMHTSSPAAWIVDHLEDLFKEKWPGVIEQDSHKC